MTPGAASTAAAPRMPASIRPDAETLPLLSSLRDAQDPQITSGISDDALLARCVWTRLSEPGDAVAGAVVGALGPVTSLNLLCGPNPARNMSAAMTKADSATLTPKRLATGVRRWLPRIDRAATVADLRTAVQTGMTLIAPEMPAWPQRLSDLGNHAPHALWVRGAPLALSASALAVVGARACTGYGSHVTTELTSAACTAGLAIVSGAAYGVDAVAHRTAIACDAPTVAVLAGGADRAYPAAHDQLLHAVTRAGAVCSELAPGAAPTRWRFLQRNRIIAALSSAVLVTEAGVRSGSLNTAGHAAELGRALGAVPGSIASATSAGCHRLIREYGAQLVATGEDVLELAGVSVRPASTGNASSAHTGPPAPASQHTPPIEAVHASPRMPAVHLRVIDALPLRGTLSVREIARIAGITEPEARDSLAELELLGFVAQTGPEETDAVSWRLLRRT